MSYNYSDISVRDLEKERLICAEKRAEEVYQNILEKLREDNKKGKKSNMYSISEDDALHSEKVIQKFKEQGIYARSKFVVDKCPETGYSEANYIEVIWGSEYKDVKLKERIKFIACAFTGLLIALVFYSIIN